MDFAAHKLRDFRSAALAILQRTGPVQILCSLGRGSLVFHVHDLDAAVRVCQGVARVFEFGFTASDRYEIGAGDTEFIGQITFDRVSVNPDQ